MAMDNRTPEQRAADAEKKAQRRARARAEIEAQRAAEKAAAGPSSAWMSERAPAPPSSGPPAVLQDNAPAIVDGVDSVPWSERAVYLFKKGTTPAFETPDDLAELIVQYLRYCAHNGEPITLTGLSLFTGHNTTQWFTTYRATLGPEFGAVAERAALIVANRYELDLNQRHAVGAIFGLKNLGWSDNVKFDGTVQVTKKQVFQIGDVIIEFD